MTVRPRDALIKMEDVFTSRLLRRIERGGSECEELK